MLPFVVALCLALGPTFAPAYAFGVRAPVAVGSWTAAPSLGQPRAEVAATALEGRVYVAGGFEPNGGDLASVEVLDPGIGDWQARAPLPQGLNHLGMAALDGVVYVAGGNVGGTPTNGLFAYDPM